MNIQIKSWANDTVLFEHNCENNSMRLTMELALKYRANLSGASLSGASLSGAKLVGARPIFQIGPIGSRCSYFTAYITDKGLRFDAGCQRQITRETFEERLSAHHCENEHAKEYRAALALIDAHAEIWTPSDGTGGTVTKAKGESQ